MPFVNNLYRCSRGRSVIFREDNIVGLGGNVAMYLDDVEADIVYAQLKMK